MKKHLSAALAIGLVGGIALAATPSAADSAFEQIITNVGQSSLAVSPDGSRIYTVTAGTGQPGTSKGFDLYNAEGTRLQSYTGYTSIRYLSDMRIGPDGNLWLSDYQSKYLHRMNFEHPTWSGWLYHYDVD
ncbi:MAG: hypothetical protein LBR21_00875, partial [Propionibacteriaceae bacterium]|nr:hypothetical protein [Propionibacteriaceae bacterium]